MVVDSCHVTGPCRYFQGLLDNGADVSLAGMHDVTAVHAACSNGHLQTIKLIVEHQADIYHPEDRVLTPFNTFAF
jgi:ankyrin repeat protein